MGYKPVIGIEIHARLFSENKIFCSCENSFGGEPNTRVCSVCTGGGAMPVLNPEAVRLGVKAGVVLGCKINNISSFDRKNYVSPDLPKGYQITQQFKPLCSDGGFEINGRKRRINNIHLEEDAAKIVYEGESVLIDYNRSGTPLIEIVTEPDFENGKDVSDFVEELMLRLKYADVCDGKIEQGSLRVDVNVSVLSDDSDKLGTRCEIKNIGSLKSLRRAVDFETNRQISIIESGGTIASETRRVDEQTGETVFMRKKESAEDYRYFPEPDISELYISDDEISSLKSTIPKLPRDRFSYYVSNFGLTSEEAKNIVSDRVYADYFESVCSVSDYPKKTASLMLVGLNRLFNKYGGTVENLSFSPKMLAELSALWGEGKITSGSAFEILEKMYVSGGMPLEIATSTGMLVSFDKESVKAEIMRILSENEKLVLDYKSGNKKIFGFLMGQAVDRLGRGVNPAGVKRVLEECLENE